MRHAAIALALTALAALAPTVAHADESQAPKAAARPDNDFLFPGNGNVSLTATTGLPFAALGEVSVGAGDSFAAGVLVTGGPFLGGLATGVNPRVDMYHFGPMRLVLEAPIIWYPKLSTADNWIVARPDVRLEGHVGAFRIHGSLGAMAAKMVGAPAVNGPIAAYGGGGLPSGVQHGSVWNTAGGGVALALSPKTSVFAEGFVILRGVELAGPEWFDFPLGTFFGVSTTL
jgi:hypothetical protein